MEQLQFIPNVLTWQDLDLTTRENYRDVFEKVYKMIGSVDLPASRYRLICRFFEIADVDLEALKVRIPGLEQNPYFLWKILMWIVNPISVTRDFKESLIVLMTNNDLNTKIIRWYQTMRNQGQGEPSLYESYIAFVRKCCNILSFILKKAQKAKLLFVKTKSWLDEVNNFQASVSSMMLGNKSRRENFDLASIMVQRRNDSMSLYEDYIQFDQDQINNNILSISGLIYPKDKIFSFEDFEGSIEDEQIFYNHHFIIQGQIPNLLSDKHLSEVSTKIDNLVKEIHQFTPDKNEIQGIKADRVKNRIFEFNSEYQNFVNNTGKDENQAKILKRSCEFLLSEIENLNLSGIQITTERLGTNRSEMEGKALYLDSYLAKQKTEKEKQINESKAATAEISKSLTLNSLPPLKSSLNYLQWRATLNRLFSHYKSELSRMALIRNSVIRVTDKKRLDTMQSSTEMLAYLQNIFGSLDYILPLTFKKLSSLPIGDDVFTVQRNYEEFSRTVQLLKDNEILDKLDRYIMETLLNKILTSSQREKYFSEVLEKEEEWKTAAGISVDPANLDTLINTNSAFEELRRNHFLNFTEQCYQTTRRLTTNYLFETHFSKTTRRVKNTKNYSTDASERQK